MITKTPKVILASASKTRFQLLKKAGLKFTVQPADVDEAQIKKISFGIPVKKIARSLAITKAKQVSGVHTQALVIGADQILDCHGERWCSRTSPEITGKFSPGDLCGLRSGRRQSRMVENRYRKFNDAGFQ